MLDIRVALLGKAEVLRGKNTMIQKGLQIGHNEYADVDLGKLRAYMKGNLGFIFATDEIRDVLAENRRWQGAKRDKSLMLILYCHRDRLVWIHLRRVSSSCSALEQGLSRARSN